MPFFLETPLVLQEPMLADPEGCQGKGAVLGTFTQPLQQAARGERPPQYMPEGWR